MLKDLLSTHKCDHAELRAQINTERAVAILAGNMVGNVQSTQSGVCARMYKGGTYGFASAAEYSDTSVKNCLTAASENAEFMDKHVSKGASLLPSLPKSKVELNRPIVEAPSQSILIDFAKELDDLVQQKYKHLTSRIVSVQGLDIEKLMVVSEGADSHFYQPRSIIYVGMTAVDNNGTPVDLYESFGGLGEFDVLFTDPKLLLPKLDELYNHVMALREAVYAKAGTHKCILDPQLGGILSHEAIGHTVEADLVLGGSVAAFNLNKQVASEMVTMIDFAHTALGEKCPLPVYVDDEGVVAQDAVLVENGILKGYMHNRESAQHFGVEPTGNARAFTFSDEPLVRMRNTAILPGKDKLADMIASIDNGYYLVKTSNGQADTTGEFTFSVNLGYEINNGKLGKAIKETSISGIAFEMLKTVDMLSDDMHWDCAGFCGKKQAMTTGMGGPALRCDVNIGGR